LPRLYIDGDWVASTGAATIDVVNPTTGGVVAEVPSGTVEDVDRAVAAARRAFDDWSQTPVAARAKVLRDVSAQISQRIEEIARAAASDIGTPLAVGRFMHAQLPATTFADMADNIERFELEKRDGSLMLVREPVGLVAAITPWNYPMHQIAAKVAPALAAGCTVVVKPSEVAPLLRQPRWTEYDRSHFENSTTARANLSRACVRRSRKKAPVATHERGNSGTARVPCVRRCGTSSRGAMRVALVTGSSRGLGRAIAERLARDSLAVAVNDRRGEGEPVAAAIREGAARRPRAPRTSLTLRR
jgi:hypothetical protein